MADITLTHDCDVLRRNAASPTTLNGDFYDTYIDENNPTVNYNGATIRVGQVYPGGKGSAYEYRGLFYYDLNSFIPADATITDADWWIYIHTTTMIDQNLPFRIHRITRNDWKEDEATWNVYKTGSNWTTAGGDFTDPFQWTKGDCFRTTGWKHDFFDTGFSMLAQVQDAWDNRNGILNFVLLHVPTWADLTSYFYMYAKEQHSTDTAKPHHLRVTYTLAGKTFEALVR